MATDVAAKTAIDVVAVARGEIEWRAVRSRLVRNLVVAAAGAATGAALAAAVAGLAPPLQVLALVVATLLVEVVERLLDRAFQARWT